MKKKAKEESAQATLSRIDKEMAKPRTAKSARREEIENYSKTPDSAKAKR